MQIVSRKAVDGAINKIFNNNTKDNEIPVDILIYSLIDEFKKQNVLSQEQKDKLGEFIFFNSDILRQLDQSGMEIDSEYISNYDDYLKFKNEVANESR